MPTRPLARVVVPLLVLVVMPVSIGAGCGPRGKPTHPTANPSRTPTIACPSGTSLAGAGPPGGSSAWCIDDDGRQHGPTREWFDDGSVRTEGAYEHGATTGQWRSYYSGAVVRSEKSYRVGTPVGTWTTYFADGSPSTVLVHEGEGKARLTEYGPAKKKLREGGLVGGARQGAWIEWDAHGNELRSQWEAGKLEAQPTSAGPVGIPECDEFIEKYRRCVADHLPEAARQGVQTGIDAMIQGFREVAAGPAKAGLASACKVAFDSTKQATASMGCVW